MSKASGTESATCPACGSGALRPFFSMPDSPTHVNFLCESEEVAVGCTRGHIRLALCSRCGLMSNTGFDSDLLEYREGYENSLHFSAVFREYTEDLVDRLIKDFDLRKKNIVEIGCGQGHFLRMLCERGGNRGTGFDPSHSGPSEETALGGGIEFVRDLYSERYAHIDADFFVSRHTLEHVQNPSELLGPLRRSIGERGDAGVFFEVPNGLHILQHLFVWDIIYEHTSYFTAASLRLAFEREGFRVRRVYEAFDGQYLCIEASPGECRKDAQIDRQTKSELEGTIGAFEREYSGYVAGWRDRLERLASERKRVVLWGAGSKGVTFLNTLDRARQVRAVIDVNPKKQGRYVAGTGQRIVAPAALRESPVDTIIVANSIYASEIKGITTNLGLEPEFLYL